MEVLYRRCCGLDVHKKMVSACCRWRDADGSEHKEIRKFGTYTAELRRLVEWLQQHQVEQVAMESTGSYWRPVWNVLESAGVSQVLANAQHIRNVPGRKTDIQDPEWIGDLLQYGLVPPSFAPGRHMRDLRELTRMRSKVVQDHTRVVNRIQAVLEDANVKLASVVQRHHGSVGASHAARLDGGTCAGGTGAAGAGKNALENRAAGAGTGRPSPAGT
jgi:transposase